MVEGRRRSCTLCDVVGGCPCLCTGGRLLYQPVFLPELRDSIELFGEVIAHWRLPVCQQGQLWSSYS